MFTLSCKNPLLPALLILPAVLFVVPARAETVLAEQVAGKVLLQVEAHGEAWYVDPATLTRFYLPQPAPALRTLKTAGLGISDAGLESIPIATATSLPALAAPVSPYERYGWWGRVVIDHAGVYAEPSFASKRLGFFGPENRIKILEEKEEKAGRFWYRIDGGAYPGAYVYSAYIAPIEPPTAPPVADATTTPAGIGSDEPWVDVDLKRRVLTLYRSGRPVFATYVSIGRSYTPTIRGEFRVWYKTPKTRMTGGPPKIPYSYDLPNVPWVMYYSGSFALHSTYWHDEFGTERSAGCTNLTQGDAAYLYSLVRGKNLDGSGTFVRNHY